MYMRSLQFDDAIKSSHAVAITADLLYGGVTISPNLPIASGSVEVDGTASVRRRCSLNIIDQDGTLAGTTSSPLTPYGREIRINRGLYLPSGAVETVPLGVFRISSVAVNDSGGSRLVAISGFDRARSVQRARFETPVTIAAGTNYSTAIANILSGRLPNITMQLATTAAVTPLLVFDQGADPWQTVVDMAASIGCVLYFDPSGTCVMEVASEMQTVVWDYGEGSSAVVVSIDDTLSDEPGYNGVVVDGEAADVPPVHAVAYDTDPASPTYSLGPYGKVPRFYRSPFIRTDAQASAAAVGLLTQERGGTEALKFTAIPHPAHEVGDLVRVADAALSIDASYYLESFSIPLGTDAMSCTTRKKRTM